MAARGTIEVPLAPPWGYFHKVFLYLFITAFISRSWESWDEVTLKKYLGQSSAVGLGKKERTYLTSWSTLM